MPTKSRSRSASEATEDYFSPEESQRRFEATLHGAIRTPPHKLKDKPRANRANASGQRQKKAAEPE